MQARFDTNRARPISFASINKAILFDRRSNRDAAVRILYVDDNDLLRNVCVESLKRAGYVVISASNGVEALNQLRGDVFHLMITDHEMPYMSGAELVNQARMEGMTLPIILASGSVFRFNDQAPANLQLDAFLQKPFSRAHLLAVVEEVLGKSVDSRAAISGKQNPSYFMADI